MKDTMKKVSSNPHIWRRRVEIFENSSSSPGPQLEILFLGDICLSPFFFFCSLIVCLHTLQSLYTIFINSLLVMKFNFMKLMLCDCMAISFRNIYIYAIIDIFSSLPSFESGKWIGAFASQRIVL